MSRFRDSDDEITAKFEGYQLSEREVRYAWNALDEPNFTDRLLTLVQKAITGPDKDTCELGRWLAQQVNDQLMRQAETDYWSGVQQSLEDAAEDRARYGRDAA